MHGLLREPQFGFHFGVRSRIPCTGFYLAAQGTNFLPSKSTYQADMIRTTLLQEPVCAMIGTGATQIESSLSSFKGYRNLVSKNAALRARPPLYLN